MSNRNILILISILLPISLFIGVQHFSLRAEEPRRAIVAMEMVLGNDYVVPKINGWNYYNKPPLFNWIIALFYKLLNSFDEWVVRLPGILSFLGMGVCTFFVTKKYSDQKTGIYAAIFTLTSADLLFYGTVNAGEIDLFFSLLTYLQVISIFHFYNQKKPTLLFVTSYLLCALGVLTKGPPSLLFQGLTLIGYLLFVKREYKLFFSIKHLLGLTLLTLITTAYFYLYYLKTTSIQGLLVNLLKEATQKSGLESSALDILKGVVVFPLNFLKLLLPWSLLLIFLFNKQALTAIRANELTHFSLIFILFNLPVYWLTGKMANRYIYMFIPFAFHILASLSVQEKSAHRFFNSTVAKVYVIALMLIISRIVFNFTFLPSTEKNQTINLKKQVDTLLVITKQQPIYLTGFPYYFDSEIAFAGNVLLKEKLKTAPLIAYQIPYYLSKRTNTVMRFDEEMKPNTYYLMYHHQIDTTKAKIIYTFKEGWQPNLNLSLITLK